ncbi:hypothetical protein [Pontibacter pudoricolor]|uniref:hypothetical protein n=1 Tax=Pontibacter pudoricolor TaxID=2694930 RepID=UPI0013913C6F|nr:hypothetical protein [Pontibacter pudoricolor]
MKTITLTNYNATLRLHGTEGTRSLELKTLTVQEWPFPDGELKLTVIDEKDVPIYSKHVQPSQHNTEEEITIGEKFVFYDHMAVNISADNPESTFAVTLNFE